MPGHSYKGSTATSGTAAVFPPVPVATSDDDIGFFQLTVLKADSPMGRPTFEGWFSNDGVGNPDNNPGDWDIADPIGPADDATHWAQQFFQDAVFFIGRTRYGFNVSAWSNVTSQ